MHPFWSDFSGEHWTETIQPVPYRFVADVDPAFVQKVLDVPERKWKSNVEYHSQADDHGAAVEVLEWVAFCHQLRLRNLPARLNRNPSDRTVMSSPLFC